MEARVANNTTNFNAVCSGLPLTSSVARKVLLHLFDQNKQWQKKDLDSAVHKIHFGNGGVKGAQNTDRVVKKSLSDLNEDKILENPALGIWRRIRDSSEVVIPEVVCESPIDDALDEIEGPVPEKIIGVGSESVYLYFNPNDRELAQIKGKIKWECKIGRCNAENPLQRIMDQGTRTALSRLPIVGLVIQSEDSSALEKALHASLRLVECEVPDSPGSEWFFYLSYFG